MYVYFVKYERQFICFIFEFYKFLDKWILFFFKFDDNFDDDFEELLKFEYMFFKGQ